MADPSAAPAATTTGEPPSPAVQPSAAATPTTTVTAAAPPAQQAAADAVVVNQPAAPTPTPAGSGKASAGRSCSKCSQTQPRSAFSKGQWEKSAKHRKCQHCMLPSSSNGSIDAIIAADEALQQQQQQPDATTPATTEPSSTTPAAAKPTTTSKPAKKSKQIAGTTTMLVTNDGEFTPTAAIVFNEIFERFDADKDGAWSLAEVQAYAKATNGKPFNTEELLELKSNFVCNDKGYLLKQGYFDLYYMHSLSQPRETFKDLEKLGYNKSLERVQQSVEEKKT